MKPFFLFIFLVVNLTFLNAQNNIGIGTQTPHASALLDVSSTTKGIMAPRMSTTERNAISSPAKGLLVYDTNLNALYHYNGAAWAAVGSGGGGFSLPFEANVNLNGPTFQIQNSGSGDVLFLGASSGSAISAYNTGNSAAISVNAVNGFGVYAQSFNSIPVLALSTNAANTLPAMRANNTGGGVGLHATSSNNDGILGISSAANKVGVRGEGSGSGGIGIFGSSTSNTGVGVSGFNAGGTGILGTSTTGYGVRGVTSSGTGFSGVYGENNGTAGTGVRGVANFPIGIGVYGTSTTGTGLSGFSNSGFGVRATSETGYALETSGKVKIAGGNTNPSTGAVLTSTDGNGNAVWKPITKVAFSVVNSINPKFPELSFKKVEFNTELYDLNNNFSPYVASVTSGSSVFTAPVSGVYHFSAKVMFHMSSSSFNFSQGALYIKKNGTIIATAEGVPLNSAGFSKVFVQVSGDFKLEPNDKIWLEAFHTNGSGSDQSFTASQGAFSGHLVYEN